MSNIKLLEVGTKVEVVEYLPHANGAAKLGLLDTSTRVDPDCVLGLKYYLGDIEGWVRSRQVQPVVPKVKKPRVKLMSSGRRQFDVTYKVTVVRKVEELRKLTAKGSKRNGVGAYIKSMGVLSSQLVYWETQFNQGHFTENRAVAFSRQATMIHG